MENERKTVAVICEYNPFHYGHRYQISHLKEKYARVVCIMSGAFVQRGEVAVEDKYRRAAAAIAGGADLVVELPFPYCVSSGGDFAAAGVRIAATLGVDALSFGCESPDATLEQIAELTALPKFEEELAALIKAQPNLSYPRGRSMLIEKHLGAEAAKAVTTPNNILAVEYMRSCIKEGAALELYPMQRQAGYKSAGEIRAAADMKSELPFPEFFGEARSIKHREREIISLLRRGDFKGLYCIDETLAATLRVSAKKATSLEDLIAEATSKTYTAARVRRAVIAAWLGIESTAVKAPPAYTCLLAANKAGTEFLKDNKKRILLPIVTKPANYTKLPEPARAAFERTVTAEEQAALCTPRIESYVSPLSSTPYIKV
ncbi:MAG: nucleotidyltransferase family protein [Clostridia bacterium]|nr:nucleotidyltransferase family protein [Clostridia bacterium]